MNDAARVARLTAIADELDDVEKQRDHLYAERLRHWRVLVSHGMKQREVAVPSRVGEGAVTQALRKLRIRRTSKA